MKLLFIFLLISVGAAAQNGNDTSKYYKSVDYGWTYQRIQLLKALLPPSDTLTNKLVGSLALVNGTIYIRTLTRWTPATGEGSGMQYADTALMLNPYALKNLVKTPKLLEVTSYTNAGDTVINGNKFKHFVIPGFTNKNILSFADLSLVYRSTTSIDSIYDAPNHIRFPSSYYYLKNTGSFIIPPYYGSESNDWVIGMHILYLE